MIEKARYLQRLVRRVSVKMFDDYNWTIIPTVIVGHEPAAWCYPSGRWAAFVWLKWNLQIALHDRPREGCLFSNRWNPPATEPNLELIHPASQPSTNKTDV